MRKRRFAFPRPWFTAILTAAILAVQLATWHNPGRHRRLVAALGINWEYILNLRAQRLLGNVFVQQSPGVTLPILLLVGVSCFAYERVRGARRAGIVFFVADFLGSAASLMLLRATGVAGNQTAVRWSSSLETGASVGAFGCLGASAAVTHGKPGIASTVLGIAAFVVPMIWNPKFSDVQHGFGFAAGALTGHLLDAVWHLSARAAESPP
ncbi:MAG: hypothetical protein R3B97_10850 [Dehalococcoidia bacterium]|nr:hypothetical protein [Dehalococcoidia bacterium]